MLVAQSARIRACTLGVGRHGEHVIADGEVSVFDVGAAARHSDHASLLRHERGGRPGIEVAGCQHHFDALFDEILGGARSLRRICFGIDMHEAQFLAQNTPRRIDVVDGDLGRSRRRRIESRHPTAERGRGPDQDLTIICLRPTHDRDREDRRRNHDFPKQPHVTLLQI